MNPHVTKAIVTTTIKEDSLEVEVTPLESDPTDTTFPKVVKALGSWEELPVLELGDRDGHTGYIDFVQGEDMTAPIMRGTDQHGRPFVAFRFTIMDDVLMDVEQYEEYSRLTSRKYARYSKVEKVGEEEGQLLVRLTETKVETIFRRYVTGSTWASGGGSDLCVSSLKDADLERIGRLVRGERLGVARFEAAYNPEDREERAARLANCFNMKQWEETLPNGKTAWYYSGECGSFSLL